MEEKDLLKEKGKWERLSVIVKAVALLACAASFLFGAFSSLDLRGLIPLCVFPMSILDFYCVYKQNKLHENKKIGLFLFSGLWFIVLFAVCFFIACIA